MKSFVKRVATIKSTPIRNLLISAFFLSIFAIVLYILINSPA
jgi:hypothetical protein